MKFVADFDREAWISQTLMAALSPPLEFKVAILRSL
jgi:hypothetical protein